MAKLPLWKNFKHIDCWIFDLDNTLYPSKSNLFAKIDVKMGEFISEFLNVDLVEAKNVQKKYFDEHGTTLNGLMQNYDIDPSDFLNYVHDIDVSDLSASPELGSALEQLPGRKIIFTNGSHYHATNVSSQLGIDHHFEHIFDIVAADYKPKPHKPVYEKLIRELDIDPEKAVLFEDMAVNLAPAHDMGMTTVWIPNDAHWSTTGAEGEHIHYQTDDLARWLTELLADRSNII
ncbi:pyrimidine 5'-nucleotidase [uncultured Sneathiella sp.]|jgi:putative hydrolase of the HAD superfamily|uniref:pyrimidine 5'-nucleotidase n=1 Tax=uncultured Sneathiella sp. TaxID=879315 RepID=UPI0030DC935E|tara:strand:+ start:170 stop:865 length:696 start_codon:yes stop_codon:yes gene_type:complete